MSVVEDIPPQVIITEAAYDEDNEQKIGSVLLEGGGAGADIWAYNEDGDVWIEFRGWRSDGSWWCVECNLYDSVDETLKTVWQAARGQLADYIRVTSVVYSKDMPDCTITCSATLNQCMDFPDQRWIDVRDQEQWFDVHIVLRRC